MAYSKKGFTIIELMIAVTVFAVAITLIMAGVIFIGRQYTRASNQVSLEESARNIHQQISESKKFSSSVVTTLGPNGDYIGQCVGSDIYIMGRFINTNTVPASIDNQGDYNGQPEGLYVKKHGGCTNISEVNISDARNLLVSGAKVTYFDYDTATDTFTTAFAKTPANGGDLLEYSVADNIRCDSTQTGREFCASTRLQSTSIGRTK